MNESLSRFLTVVHREMRTMGRGRALFFLRFAYAILITGLLWMIFDRPLRSGDFWTGASISALAGISASAFSTMVRFQSILVLMMSPLLGVLCITSEWRDQTMGLLVLSPLRASEIVGGKAVALLGFLGMLLVAPLPLFALLGWAGGMEYRWLAGLAVLSLVLGILGLSIGIVSGLRYRGSVPASILAYALLSGALLLPPALEGRVASSVAWYLDTLHPTTAIGTVATQGIDKQYLATVLCVHAGVAFLLLCFAAWDLPRAVGRTPLRSLRSWFTTLDGFYQRINVGGVELVQSARDPKVRGNPVSWLTRSGQGLGSFAHVFRWAAAVTIFCLLSLFLLVSPGQDELYYTMLYVGMLLAALTAGASAVAGERTRKSLSVLLSCPLRARTILGGKIRASLRFFLVVGLPLLVYSTVLLTVLDRPYSLLYSSMGMFWLVGEAVCAFSLAVACSLYMKTPLRAGISALFLLGALHVLPMIGGATGYSLFQFSNRSQVDQFLRFTLFPALTGGLIVGSACVFAFARYRRSRGLQTVALLTGVLPVLGLLSFFPAGNSSLIEETLESTSTLLGALANVSRWVADDMAGFFWLGLLLLTFSQLTFLYTGRCFDDVLGRSS